MTGYILGGSLLATGVVLWLLSPGDEGWARTHAITVAPSARNDGGMLGLAGRW